MKSPKEQIFITINKCYVFDFIVSYKNEIPKNKGKTKCIQKG